MPNEIDVKGLRELESKATPGPWGVYSQIVGGTDDVKRELGLLVDGTDGFSGLLPMVTTYGERSVCPAVSGCGPEGPANAEFIAAARNALPALLDRIEELEREHSPFTREQLELIQAACDECRPRYEEGYAPILAKLDAMIAEGE